MLHLPPTLLELSTAAMVNDENPMLPTQMSSWELQAVERVLSSVLGIGIQDSSQHVHRLFDAEFTIIGVPV
jgi:hypothetical protein